jgi:hypothetical protein
MEAISFSEAADRLEAVGIKAECIYLIDLILLIEVAWADGKIQPAETGILLDYLSSHVAAVNRLAGTKVLTVETARAFVEKLLKKRPAPAVIQAVHDVIRTVRVENKNTREDEILRLNVLNACLDIASSAVTRYPYGLKERFTTEEKACYHEIEKLLTA